MAKHLLHSSLFLFCTASLFSLTGCATKTAETATRTAETTTRTVDGTTTYVDEKGEYIWVDQGVASRVRKKVYIGKKEHTTAPVESVEKSDVNQMMNATRIPTPGN